MKNLKTLLKYKRWAWFWLCLFLFCKLVDKKYLVEAISKALPLRESVLLAGMVWGEKGGIPTDFYNSLKNTGLIHIVVVSGANLAMVGKGIVEFGAKFWGRKTAIISGMGLVLWYVDLVGWQIPVVRALLFLGIYYWSQLLGRRFSITRTTVLIGAIMVLADFRILTDISFWLSMLAFIAVALNKGKSTFITTIWVSLFIVPVLSIYFETISVITPLANVAVLFLVEGLTIIGFLGSILSLIWLGLGRVVLGLSYPMLRYLIEVVEIMGRWRGGAISFQFNWWMLLGWYLIIGGYWYEKKKI